MAQHKTIKGKVTAFSEGVGELSTRNRENTYNYVQVGDLKYGNVMFDDLMETELRNAFNNDHTVEIAAVKHGKKWYFGSMKNLDTNEEFQGATKGYLAGTLGITFTLTIFGLLLGGFIGVNVAASAHSWTTGLIAAGLIAAGIAWIGIRLVLRVLDYKKNYQGLQQKQPRLSASTFFISGGDLLAPLLPQIRNIYRDANHDKQTITFG